MSAPRGHVWVAANRERPFTPVNVVMHVVARDVTPLPPVPAQVCQCLTCGLLLARHDRDDDGTTKAFGVDLDSLAVMGSAPVCNPNAFSMGCP